MSAADIGKVRATLGDFWQVGKPISHHELATVLRLRGDDAMRTVSAWELGTRTPSGPVTLALELLTPPSPEKRKAAAAYLGAMKMPEGSTPRPGLTLRGFLRSYTSTLDADALLELLVERAAEALLTPEGLDTIIGTEPSTTAIDRTGMYRSAVRAQTARTRPAPEVVRIGIRKKSS